MDGADHIRARAHAKVNLALAIGPPRPMGVGFAGYHPIASWMHAIALHDDIEIARADKAAYDIAWADGSVVSWDTESDLCVRAHRALEALVGRGLGVSLRVRKRIPAGGGLGGGSADAACVLLALRDLFALPVSDADLIACAHGLGTDIPFFVDPVAWRAGQPARPAVVSGLGDRIERVGRMQDAITLIVPGFGCATGAVYRAFDESPTSVCDHARVLGVVAACLERGAVDAGLLFNDLAAAAERVEPRLGELRRALAQTLGTPVHVSGSGSTLFCFGGSGVPISDGFSGRAMGSRLA